MITLSKLTPDRIKHIIATRSGYRNIMNRLRYGPLAPKTSMHIKISPTDLHMRYHVHANNGRQIHHWETGLVINGDWDLSARAFDVSAKYTSCKQHFLEGKPWVETSAWKYGLQRIAKLGKYDACTNEDDLMRRYERLDELFEIAQSAKALPATLHHKTTSRTGLLVHINREGELLFGNQGFHRLSIAKLAELPEIVVVVGIVHPDALQTEAYKKLLGKRVNLAPPQPTQ